MLKFIQEALFPFSSKIDRTAVSVVCLLFFSSEHNKKLKNVKNLMYPRQCALSWKLTTTSE